MTASAAIGGDDVVRGTHPRRAHCTVPAGRRALLVLAVALLAGCAARVAAPPTTGAEPPGFPASEYERASTEGKPVYRVDPATSNVVVEVRRAGSLARLGHDHVVAGYDIRGYMRPDDNRADLYVALDSLVVDEIRLREMAGFDTQPSADAIEGTRRNMLGRVLEAERFPFAVVGVRGLDDKRVASVSVTLHGMTRTIPVPLDVEARPGDWIVSGAFRLNQTDFGIVPLSLLGGAIEVQDAIDLHFRIHAVRIGR